MGGQRYCEAPVELGAARLLSSVFVYGARLSYLWAVLTPLSSCLKSVLLIFLFIPSSANVCLPLSLAPPGFFFYIMRLPNSCFVVKCLCMCFCGFLNFNINFSMDYQLSLARLVQEPGMLSPCTHAHKC